MYTKDIERVVRGFVAQKLEIEYIRHYLMENYQLDRKTADQVLEKVGVRFDGGKGPIKGPDKGADKGPDKNKIQRQSFY